MDCLTVLRAEIQSGRHIGQGECVPSASRMVSRSQGRRIAMEARNDILAVRSAIESGATQDDLLQLLPRGPARNAVDCALWDLAAKQADRPIAELLDLKLPESLVTAYTISLTPPNVAGAEARANCHRQLLKVKLGRHDDDEIIAAVRQGAPDSDIIVDVNGGWTLDRLRDMCPVLSALGVRLLEQPLPSDLDACLEDFESPIPIAADESCGDRSDLGVVAKRYDWINIKLDKTGGLTEALLLAREARRLGLGILVGCMAGTSLSMAPAIIVASLADLVDLDGPLLLKTDRDGGMLYRGDRIHCANRELWG